MILKTAPIGTFERRTGVRLPLVSKFFASFQINYDFDNQPADGKDKYDAYWTFGLGWQF